MSHPIRIPQPLQHLTEPLFPSPSLRASIELSCLSSWSLGSQVLSFLPLWLFPCPLTSWFSLPVLSSLDHCRCPRLCSSSLNSRCLRLCSSSVYSKFQMPEAMPFLTSTVNLLSSYQGAPCPHFFIFQGKQVPPFMQLVNNTVRFELAGISFMYWNILGFINLHSHNVLCIC